MSTLAPPTRKRAARWLCLAAVAAVAAVLLSGCGTAVGYANTFLELQEAGINGADIATSGEQVTLEYDSSAAPGDQLVEEQDRAAEVIWRHLPQRFSTLRVDPRVAGSSPRDYSREELQGRFGPRPARLDQGSGDIEQDARNTFRNILIGAAIGFGVLLALVILVIVLVVRAARKRRPPAPTAGWPSGPAGPQAPWPQQPGYGPPPAQQWSPQGQPPAGPPPAQQWAGQGQPTAAPAPPWQPGADQPAAPYPPPPPSAYGQQGYGGWQPPPTPPPAPPEGETGSGSEEETRVLDREGDQHAPDQRHGGPTPPA